MRALPHKTFRTDINGLRALAVMFIVLCHFGVPGFGGGYTGVDILFVISGFLMTQAVCEGLADRSFSLSAFYAARARRVLPVLAAVSGLLIALGPAFMTPDDFRLLGGQALAALTFTSNIVLSHVATDAQGSAAQWLRHTWVLSVLWQFYILLPLVLVALHRWKRPFMKDGVAGLFLISLALSVVWTSARPGEAFYLLPTRAWEMLAGALLFLYGGTRAKSPRFGEIGLVFILTAAWFYTPGLKLPGTVALLPVAGAVLIMAARPRDALLDNRFMQFMGRISYSLYLWHWPVLVAARHFDVEMTHAATALLLLATVGLATLSDRLIEAPFRRDHRRGLIRLGAYALLPVAAAVVFYG